MPTVRVEVVGENERSLCLDDNATYGDLLAALSFTSHEAAVLLDGTPVPEDGTIDADRVRVLRLIEGGARPNPGVVDDRVRVRPATAEDHLDVMRVVDGAALEADAATVRKRIEAGDVRVATVGETVVGALVCDGDRITAVATRRRWRDHGVGTALVSAAAERRDRLVAEFDPNVRRFYESLGFEITETEPADDRLRGER